MNFRFSILLILSVFVFGCLEKSQFDHMDKSLSYEARVEILINKMTLKEKVFQLNQSITGNNINDNNVGEIDSLLRPEIGSLIIFNSSPEFRNKIQRKTIEETRLGIPILFGFDVIHGFRTVYPIPLAQSCSWNPKLVENASAMAAKESVLAGIDWTFSPMIDVSRDPRWGRITECYGEDPYVNSVFGVATVEGYQGNDLSDPLSIAACLKHYVGYGASQGGRDYRYTNISKQSLWETYLPPYEACLKAGAATVMSGFNDLNGVPATSNHYTLTEVLKQKWKYKGFVVSDWNAVEQLVYQGVAKDGKDAALKAFKAGIEMNMKDGLYLKYLEELIGEDKINEKEIDEAVSRILLLKFQLGLFDDPYTQINEKSERFLSKDDIKIAEKLAEESIVLLKNNQNFLPMSKQVKSIALVGPMANNKTNLLGSWAFNGKEEDVESIYEGFQSEFGAETKIHLAKGCEFDGEDERFFNEALEAANKSEIVFVCLGEKKEWSGENASRSTIRLPEIQETLVSKLKALGKPMVLILSNGRPIELSAINEAFQSIIEIWQPGIAGGTPLAKIISGTINPSGKLSVTFPFTTGQIPMYYNMRPSARPYQKMGDYQDISTKPLYSFGQGLSYTN